MPAANPLEIALNGFVAVSNSGPDGFAVGGYSGNSADSVRNFPAREGDTVTNLKRARHIARTYHDWEVSSERELTNRAMRGELA